MARGKSLHLFLMDGTANGIIKCTLDNWTGLSYKIPRTLLAEAHAINFLNQTGIYFLFGENAKTGELQCYVGQAGVRKNGKGILSRLDEHKRPAGGEDWWTTAIAFTTSNNTFGPTEINYLENRFYNMAVEAGRYKIKNSVDPNPGNITEEKESELEDYIDYAKIIMGAFGYKLFEHLRDKPQSQEPLLYLEHNKRKSTGQHISNGFVLFAGSRISPGFTESAPNSARKYRDQHADKINQDYTLVSDVTFRSAWAAAVFVTGASMNANDCWKTKDGTPLGELKQNK